MKAFTLATVTALLSTTYAATVSLEETACLQNNTSLEKFDIEVGKLVAKDLKSVCGLKITSSSGIDVNAIECQAYKDAEGKEPGSAKFTYASPALIATNPVQVGAIQCDEIPANTTTVVTFVTASPSATGTAVSSGGSVPSGNATVPSVTGGPTAQPTGPSESGSSTGPSSPQNTGAAGQVGMSAGALIAAFAVLLL